MKKGVLLSMALALTLAAGCKSNEPRPSAASETKTSVEESELRPGFNAKGEVVDPSKVEEGDGTKVKAANGTKGEVFGVALPGSKFAKVQIGMDFVNAGGSAGMPNLQRKCRAMLYTCTEWIYEGHGRLVFATQSLGYNTVTRLIKIIHSRNETGS